MVAWSSEPIYATDKYKGKKLINWGKPAIWISNEDPREQLGADVDWLNKNVTFVYIDTPDKQGLTLSCQ